MSEAPLPTYIKRRLFEEWVGSEDLYESYTYGQYLSAYESGDVELPDDEGAPESEYEHVERTALQMGL